MITRHHTKDDAPSWAGFSDCEAYRYSLTRIWDEKGRKVMFVMLNPSTADETRNDPTVERCERRARVLGYGGFRVTNIFAFRATDPKDMRRARDPNGPDNNDALLAGAIWADDIIAAWGVHGEHRDRGLEVAHLLQATGVPTYHLGLTKAGHPRHPLYVSYSQKPEPWHEVTLV